MWRTNAPSWESTRWPGPTQSPAGQRPWGRVEAAATQRRASVRQHELSSERHHEQRRDQPERDAVDGAAPARRREPDTRDKAASPSAADTDVKAS
jgi:hypothetical protein